MTADLFLLAPENHSVVVCSDFDGRVPDHDRRARGERRAVQRDQRPRRAR